MIVNFEKKGSIGPEHFWLQKHALELSIYVGVFPITVLFGSFSVII